MAQATGFSVVGLSESIKLLGKADKELRGEATLIVRTAAVGLKREAQRKLPTAPGVSRNGYKLDGKRVPKTAISHRATPASGKILLNPRWRRIMNVAEFGWTHQFIPYRGKGNGGRFVKQGSMKRRTFPIYKGNQFRFPKYQEKLRGGPGWIIQPVLRKRLGDVQADVNEGMFIAFGRAAKRAGLKPKGSA